MFALTKFCNYKQKKLEIFFVQISLSLVVIMANTNNQSSKKNQPDYLKKIFIDQVIGEAFYQHLMEKWLLNNGERKENRIVYNRKNIRTGNDKNS